MPTHYNLPVWLSDPQAVVLMARTRTEISDEPLISFRNLLTGERFDLPALDRRSVDLSWFQDETGIYFEQGRYRLSGAENPPIKQVNIVTGALRLLPPLSNESENSGSAGNSNQTGVATVTPQPCTSDGSSSLSHCFSLVNAWAESQQLETDLYHWLPSGQGISFVARNDSSSLCILTAATGEISCPLDAAVIAPDTLSGDSAIFIVDYQWSPDGRYLWLAVDPFGPESDDRTFSQIATAAADGSQFQLLGLGHDGLWRPDLNP